jgi:sulfate adenylyltransferase subunit 1 (EFTu-like GTPase family)
MDFVDFSEDAYEKIRQEFTIFSTRLRIKHINFIPMSGLLGDNVVDRSVRMPWYQGEPLLSFLEDVHIASDWNLQDSRFPVQWVIRPQDGVHRDFRAYAGQIASGVFRVGDRVLVLPSGRSSKIKDIVLMDQSMKIAHAPMSVSLLLEDEIDVSRGDLIVPVENLPYISKEAEAMLCWMHETPMQPGRKYLFKHTTNSTKGVIAHIHCRMNVETLEEEETSVLELNEIGKVSIRSATPLVYDEYYRNRRLGGFIVVDETTSSTVGAGMLVEPTKSPPLPEYTDYAI